ncbi:MAG TPA: TetR/AcrR family transcriptional regulator [Candidatus Paceibacterota bacterium]
MANDNHSEKPLNRRQLAKIRTREKVLDAGLALFLTGGYEKATIRDIAKQAGMSTGAVFANFKDKIDLLLACVHEELEPYDGLLKAAAQEEGTVLDRIVRVCVADFEFFGERIHLMEALARIETHHHGSKALPARRLADQRRGNLEVTVHQLLQESQFGSMKEIEAISVIVCNAHHDACRHSKIRNWDMGMYQSRLKELLSFIVLPNGMTLAA